MKCPECGSRDVKRIYEKCYFGMLVVRQTLEVVPEGVGAADAGMIRRLFLCKNRQAFYIWYYKNC